MSCNYAEGLSEYPHKGRLGIPEVFDDEVTVKGKVGTLGEWMREAKHVVVHTGAGISTSAGIPDFRGPNGVWTLEEKGLKPNVNLSFDSAAPSITHMGLSALIQSGHVKYVISQNIDGLHLRSGLKRANISELHGNMFVARCSYCEREFVRTSVVPTVGQKEIGMACPWVKGGGRVCRGKLRDNILDWEHDLPVRDLDMADLHSTIADLSICLGTTLQIIPAGNLPLKAKKNKGKVVIINLQPTKHHKKADLVIHTQVDKVISQVADILGVNIPPYSSEIDPTFILRNEQNLLFPSAKSRALADWTISLSSVSKMKSFVAELKDTKPKKTVERKKRKAKKEEDDDASNDDEKDEVVEIKKSIVVIPPSLGASDEHAETICKTEPVANLSSLSETGEIVSSNGGAAIKTEFDCLQ